ncbi:MAG: lipopolysaccharide biosynthesis protein, partial [Myxococcota bacterium]
QGVSHSVAQTPDDQAGDTVRRTFKTHLAIAVPVAVLFFFFAPVYAQFQGAPHIVRPLQVVSLVVLFYGLYAPLVGALNGQRKFTKQAALDITYATLRTIGLLGLGWLFAKGEQGVLGACIGFAAAAMLIFPVALKTTGLGTAGSAGPTVKQHLLFIAPVALGQIFLQLLMQSDISVLGHFASKLVVAQGMTGELAREASDEIVGVYRACQLFAFLPFQLLITLTFIMFPMLAKAKAEQDKDAVAAFVRTGMRLAFVFACVMVGTVSSLAPQVLHLLFPHEVGQRGGEALRILALGQGAFSIFYIETTVLTSLGRERISAMLTGVAAALIATLCAVAGITADVESELLLRTATATSVALLTAASLGAIMVYRAAGAYVPPLTAVRVFIALAVLSAVGYVMPYAGKLLVVPQAIGMGLLAVIVLLVTREVGRADLQVLLKVVKK